MERGHADIIVAGGVADLDPDAGVGEHPHQFHVPVDLGRHRDQSHRRLRPIALDFVQAGFAREWRLGAQLA
jgi:hypothetical protein